jgi:hypothetical protein
MKKAKESYVNLLLLLALLFFSFNVAITSADPYALDLSETTCLAKDIVTGPVGWECETPSGSYIITFFGVNRASIDGTFLTVRRLDCNSFSIDELKATYTNLKVSDSKNFIATESLSGESPVEIKCTYIPPPAKPSELDTPQ